MDVTVAMDTPWLPWQQDTAVSFLAVHIYIYIQGNTASVW